MVRDLGGGIDELWQHVRQQWEEIRRLRSQIAATHAGSNLVAGTVIGVLPPGSGGTGYTTGSGPVVAPFLNNSGGALSDGDVVVIDASGARLINTTTSAANVLAVGVVRDINTHGPFAAGAETPVMLLGNHASVKVVNAVAAGDYLETSTSAGRAASGGAMPMTGAFAIAETAFAGPGNGTVTAFIFGNESGGGAGLPTGGTTGQALLKDSAADGDASWHDIEDESTAETNTARVLAPDGAGGVAFVPISAAGGVTNVRTYLSFGVNESGQSNPAGIGHGVDAYKAAVQSIGNNSSTALIFDTEVQDTDGYHDNVTNNTRLTVPAGLAGVYLIVGQGDWGANSAGRRIHDIRTNGSNFINTNNTFVSGATNNAPSIIATALIALIAGDYVEFLAYQDSGSSVNCTPKIRMYKVG